MADVVIENLTVQYGSVVAVDDLSLHIRSGELVTLLGPSGCGKTTALRCLAGLEPRSAGTITIGSRVVAGPNGDVPPEHRKLNMVFQNYAIWPHMTVMENISFGLKIMKLPKDEVRRRGERALELVGLTAFRTRYGNELSGGQQQRVAVARAIVTEPDVLLFDEPLSNLDASLREQMRVELRELHDRLGKTAIYVTHDQAEAMSMSDRIVLMNNGRIVQQGAPEAVFERPRTRFAATFMGIANIWNGVVENSPAPNVFEILLDDTHRLRIRVEHAKPRGRGAVAVRSERVEVSPTTFEGNAANIWKGSVRRKGYLGGIFRYDIAIGERIFYAETNARQRYAINDEIWVRIDPDAAIWIPEEAK
jgi:iron(III) transport system ATP-binding protein